MLVVEINEFVFGTIYVHAVVKGGGYCSQYSRQLEWKQAPLTTCDNSDDVIMAHATGTFPFCRWAMSIGDSIGLIINTVELV